MEDYPFCRILEVAQYVIRHGHTGPFSTGESLAGVLAAGDMKALRELGYSTDAAIARVGAHWCQDVFSQRMALELLAFKADWAARKDA